MHRPRGFSGPPSRKSTSEPERTLTNSIVGGPIRRATRLDAPSQSENPSPPARSAPSVENLSYAFGRPSKLGRGEFAMTDSFIALTGLSPKVEGLEWESGSLLRIGRQSSVEVMIQDASIEKLHVEIKFQGQRWMARPLTTNEFF